eukprot:358177-Chlamydomonas_euryale.AAC.3
MWRAHAAILACRRRPQPLRCPPPASVIPPLRPGASRLKTGNCGVQRRLCCPPRDGLSSRSAAAGGRLGAAARAHR